MTLPVDWSLEGTARRRDTYYAASQRKFVPFVDPMIFRKGSMQYLWDEAGRKYTDLLGMNVCISVGHSHPVVVRAAMEQAAELTHCTTMFYHPVPAHLAEELAATMPKGPKGDIEWVVHFTNSGSEAIDLAMVMARGYTGNLDLLALRNAYHGPTSAAQSLTGIAGFRHWHQIPFLQAMPDRKLDAMGDLMSHWIAEGDYVCETGWPNMRLTLSGDGWMGIAPAGREVLLRSLDFWRIEDGLIRENWVLVDLLDLYAQLGVDVFARLRAFNKARRLGPMTLDPGLTR